MYHAHPLCSCRCRALYEKYLEWNPANASAWLKYAELEMLLAESGRARALYELAISQPVLDMPEALWKAYIDFEIAQVCEETHCDSPRMCWWPKHVTVPSTERADVMEKRPALVGHLERLMRDDINDEIGAVHDVCQQLAGCQPCCALACALC